MGEKTTGEHTEITISEEDGYLAKVAKGLPVVGGLYPALDTAFNGGSGDIRSDAQNVLVSTGAFVQSCTDTIKDAAEDPLGLLVSNGLNFLLAVIQPLQDLLHVVTGDGPALANAAGNFANIGKGLQKLGEEMPAEAEQKLDQWKGDASTAANDRISEFSDGVLGIAAMSGNVAALLQASSMLMVVIEDVIKAIISELATWMLEIWIPALAASGPTFGGSVTQAGTLTWLKASQTVLRTGDRVDRAGILSDMVAAAMEKARKAIIGQFKGGKGVKNLINTSKALEYQAIGETQSADRTSDALDF